MDAAVRQDTRAHALKRARQRYGIRLSERDLAGLEERVRDGGGELLRLDSDGCRVVLVRFLFDQLTVVFDPERDCIVTVLPRYCREFKRRPSERDPQRKELS